MEYTLKNGNVIVSRQDFDLAQTLDCGQAFRWSQNERGWTGFRLDKQLELEENSNGIILLNTSEEEFLSIWADYFDLNRDYGELKKRFSASDKLLGAACESCGGIRLLRQEPWETLCSFIISQNNNIPRIKGIIVRLCELFGHFPSAEELASKDAEYLQPIRAGFRARYLIDAAIRVASGEISLEALRTAPIAEARSILKTICGVGDKVAECELLFGLGRIEAFPVDVWIKRVLAQYYPNGFPHELSAEAGIAQQYLFHYIRTVLPHENANPRR